jgi:hypothetical protein
MVATRFHTPSVDVPQGPSPGLAGCISGPERAIARQFKQPQDSESSVLRSDADAGRVGFTLDQSLLQILDRPCVAPSTLRTYDRLRVLRCRRA